MAPSVTINVATVLVLLFSVFHNTYSSNGTEATDSNSTSFRLTILHTGDVRGRSMPVDGWLQECPFSPSADSPYDDCAGDHSDHCEIAPSFCAGRGWCSPCSGGIAARVKYFENVYRENPNTIALDSANYYFGSLWFFYYNGDASNSVLNDALWADDSDMTVKPLYDAMGISAADFFRGPEAMVSVRRTTSIPIVSSNLDWSQEPSMTTCVNRVGQECFKPFVVVERSGRKIGIIAVAEQQLKLRSSPGDNVKISDNGDTVVSLKKAMYELQKEHPDVNIIVMISALEKYQDNVEVAQKVENIDAIVSLQRSATTHLQIVRNLVTGNKVYIGNSELFGRAVGRLELLFDDEGNVLSHVAEKTSLQFLEYTFYANGTSNADEISDTYTWNLVKARHGDANRRSMVPVFSINQYISGRRGPIAREAGECKLAITIPNTESEENQVCPPLHDELSHWYSTEELESKALSNVCCPFENQPECVSECELFQDHLSEEWKYPTGYCCANAPELPCCPMDFFWENQGCRHSGCPMGYLITDALMYMCDDCDVAIMNAGGIRDDFGSEGLSTEFNVTYGDVIKVFPFQNTAVTVRVPGTVLLSVFQHAISSYDPGDGSGKFLQFAGARVSFHPVKGSLAGLEVCSKWSRQEAKCIGVWADVTKERSRLFKVALNNFLVSGGDGYSMFVSDPSTSLNQVYDVNDIGMMMDQVMVNYFNEMDGVPPLISSETLVQYCSGFKPVSQDAFAENPQCRLLKSTDESPFQCSNIGLSSCNQIESGNYTSLLPVALLEDEWANTLLSNLLLVQNGSCSDCGGFGFCQEDSGYTCQCEPTLFEGFEYPRQYDVDVENAIQACLNVGDHGQGISSLKGILMSRGAGCEDLRTPLVIGGITKTLAALSATLISIVCVGTSAVFVLKRNHGVVRASQPEFLHATNLGGLVGAMLLMIIVMPPTDTVCNAIPLLMVVWFSLLITPLLVKSHILLQIFQTKSMKTYKKNTPLNIFNVMFVAFGQMFLGIGLQTAYPFHPTLLEVSEKVAPWSFAVICHSRSATGSSNGMIWAILLLGCNGALVVSALFYAVQTRKINAFFNESKHLGFAVYNVCIIAVTTVPAMYMVSDSPSTTAYLRILVVLLVTMSTVLIIFVPKYLLLNTIAPNVTPLELAKNAAMHKETDTVFTATKQGTSRATISTSLNGIQMDIALRKFSIDKLLSTVSDQSLEAQNNQIKLWLRCTESIREELLATSRTIQEEVNMDAETVRLPETVPDS